MNRKIEHIRNLVYVAYVDKDFHEKEKDFIRQVGKRLGLGDEIIEREIQNKDRAELRLPKDEVLRFILLDDIFNLIVSDNVIKDEEIQACERIAEQFGFDKSVVDNFIDKLNKHIENGFIENKTDIFIKNELYKLAAKNYADEKYN